MSKTLFWYIFRDLVRIFVMASIVLAGIMSFGGLLKPLTKYGLRGSQVMQMLAYFMPAMQTYSLPIAALFATTVVYGRLSSDNELTACRASGISYPSLTMPAVMLGLALSIVSLLSLSYIVPHYTLKVEKVAFGSVADVVLKAVQRTHQLRMGWAVIYAESAEALPASADRPGEEVVRLHGPMFARYEKDVKTKVSVPTEFFTARSATVVLRQKEDEIEFTAHLEDGASFPRDFAGRSIAGIGAAQVGPIPHESMVRENTKFMNIAQLKELYNDPTRSREIRGHYRTITSQEQEQAMVGMVVDRLKNGGQFRFETEQEAWVLAIEPQVKVVPEYSKVVLASHEDTESRQVRLQRVRGGQVEGTDEARELVLRMEARDGRMRLEFGLNDVMVGATKRDGFKRYVSMPLPPALAAMENRGPEYYLHQAFSSSEDVRQLRRKLPGLRAEIVAEIHGRVSFAVSCLVLVMVGCGLGMMFRTGNYLSAFALSVMPALVCIALIVTGQHVCGNNPANMKLGLGILWSGNVMVMGLVMGVMGHLRRQ